jgi:hypothetical protein
MRAEILDAERQAATTAEKTLHKKLTKETEDEDQLAHFCEQTT